MTSFGYNSRKIVVPTGKCITPWCSREVYATLGHIHVDGVFILDDKWPIPADLFSMVVFQVSRIWFRLLKVVVGGSDVFSTR